MTDLAQPAGDGAFDLPPYDPYAGWDAPAPYIKEVPAQPAGMAEAIAAGLLPDPAQPPAPQVVAAATPEPLASLPLGAPQAPAPLTLLPQLPEMPLPPAGRTYELANFSRRARATTIDSFLLAIPTGLLMALVMPHVYHSVHTDQSLTSQLAESATNPGAAVGSLDGIKHWIVVAGIVSTVIYWVVLALYSGFFMTRSGGQTPGRRAAGIRVMREDGGSITFGWAVWRTVILGQVVFTVASLFTFGLATVAQYGWSLWDHDRRSLHDVLARSRVVVDAARIP